LLRTEKAEQTQAPIQVLLMMIDRIGNRQAWQHPDPRYDWITSLYDQLRKNHPKRDHHHDGLTLTIMINATRRILRGHGVSIATKMFDEYVAAGNLPSEKGMFIMLLTCHFVVPLPILNCFV
jgi:hypothetical protein